MKQLWKGLQIALVVLLLAILLCNLYVIAARNLLHKSQPTIFGWSWAVILSGSMEPAVSLDDLIICKAQKSYQVGDIVTFSDGGRSTTHRIVGESEGRYLTRGDANNTVDAAPIAPGQIVGKVVLAVPKVGLVIGWMRTPLGMLCLVAVSLLLIEVPFRVEKGQLEKGEQGGKYENRRI